MSLSWPVASIALVKIACAGPVKIAYLFLCRDVPAHGPFNIRPNNPLLRRRRVPNPKTTQLDAAFPATVEIRLDFMHFLLLPTRDGCRG
jgi:hypothetical protein